MCWWLALQKGQTTQLLALACRARQVMQAAPRMCLQGSRSGISHGSSSLVGVSSGVPRYLSAQIGYSRPGIGTMTFISTFGRESIQSSDKGRRLRRLKYISSREEKKI